MRMDLVHPLTEAFPFFWMQVHSNKGLFPDGPRQVFDSNCENSNELPLVNVCTNTLPVNPQQLTANTLILPGLLLVVGLFEVRISRLILYNLYLV